MVEMLILYASVPLDVNSKNFIGVTPLHVAALLNSNSCAMLLKCNADVYSTTKLGYTQLQYAAKDGSYKACRQLCLLEERYSMGQVQYCVNKELNINWLNFYQQTALHLVIDARNGAIMLSEEKLPFRRYEDNYTKIVRFLLKMGADVNIKDYAGDTPLHMAVRHEMDYIVNLLLHYNADIYAKNNRDEIALNLVKTNSRPHVKNLIMANEFHSTGQ